MIPVLRFRVPTRPERPPSPGSESPRPSKPDATHEPRRGCGRRAINGVDHRLGPLKKAARPDSMETGTLSAPEPAGANWRSWVQIDPVMRWRLEFASGRIGHDG